MVRFIFGSAFSLILGKTYPNVSNFYLVGTIYACISISTNMVQYDSKLTHIHMYKWTLLLKIKKRILSGSNLLFQRKWKLPECENVNER